MTDTVRDHARAMMAKAPESARQRFTPADGILAMHGIRLGEWACPDCGRVYSEADYPQSFCAGCRRPLPGRCDFVDEQGQPCPNLVEPTKYDFAPQWASPGPFCDSCLQRAARARRRETLRKTFPEKERAKLREGYRSYHHRIALDVALDRWVETDCGRDIGKPWIVAWGGTGSGKTLALLYYGAAAYHGRGLVDSIAYVTEEELSRAASLEWSRDDDEREEARALIKRCFDADLLILDELGAQPQYSDAQSRCFIRILKLRIDGSKPTLIAMNRNLQREERQRPLAWLDIRVDSRLEELATVVACTGVDLRRRDQ